MFDRVFQLQTHTHKDKHKDANKGSHKDRHKHKEIHKDIHALPDLKYTEEQNVFRYLIHACQNTILYANTFNTKT